MRPETKLKKLVYPQAWWNGLTQREIAVDLGCHQSTVSRRLKAWQEYLDQCFNGKKPGKIRRRRKPKDLMASTKPLQPSLAHYNRVGDPYIGRSPKKTAFNFEFI